ncbi:MAG: hypothetical protein M1551_01720 [Firmicutes bacterium]|nr:hypothetical protein [Bacillota bacterium]
MTKLFAEAGSQENAPSPVALASLMLNFAWFVGAGAFISQEYQIGAFGIGSLWTNLFFWLSGIINCSLLIKSYYSFIFAGTGLGALGLLYMLEYIDTAQTKFHELLWFLAGEQGEHILLMLCFALVFMSALCLILLFLWLQTVKSREWAQRVLLTVQCALLTLSMLSMFRPSGLSGSPAGVALVFVILSLLLLPILLAAVLWYTQRHDEQVTRKIFWAAFTVQLIVAIGAVYYYAVSPVVRHLGQPVDVREIRLGVGTLSPPFVEEGAAYLVSGDGRLHEVNLLTGREQILAHISLPEPAEMGYPGYRGGVGLTEGSIARKAQDELALKAVYSLWSETDQGSQVKYLTLEVTVNQVSGQISWRPTGYIDRPGYSLPKPAEGAGITIFPPVFDGLRDFFPMRISGAGVETTIIPKGRVLWTYAGKGWLLAGTDQGVLYIIDAGFNLAPDEI